jgi:hypothetical protein
MRKSGAAIAAAALSAGLVAAQAAPASAVTMHYDICAPYTCSARLTELMSTGHIDENDEFTYATIDPDGAGPRPYGHYIRHFVNP